MLARIGTRTQTLAIILSIILLLGEYYVLANNEPVLNLDSEATLLRRILSNVTNLHNSTNSTYCNDSSCIATSLSKFWLSFPPCASTDPSCINCTRVRYYSNNVSNISSTKCVLLGPTAISPSNGPTIGGFSTTIYGNYFGQSKNEMVLKRRVILLCITKQ